MKRRRARWQRHQARIDPTRLVFIDETWVKTNMAPLRGWAPKGDRLPGAAPFGHWNTSTFIAALRHDRIDAPWVFDGPVNGDIFRTYVEQVLVPTLRPGDVVVMDNLGSHKSKTVRNAIRAAGAHLLFLPPYSPDLTPSNRPSPNSNTGCAAPLLDHGKPSGVPSARSLIASLPKNARTTSQTQDTLPSKPETL